MIGRQEVSLHLVELERKTHKEHFSKVAGVRHRFIPTARARQYRSYASGIMAATSVPLCCHSRCNPNCSCEDIYFMAQGCARWRVGSGNNGGGGIWNHLAFGTYIRLRAKTPFELAVCLFLSGTGHWHLDCVDME